MENLLEHLVDYVGQNFADAKLVDEDYGQLEMLDDPNRDTYPLVFPAVLIDAPDTTWSNVEGRNQLGTAQVRVRLVLDCYDDTHYGSGTTDRIASREEQRRRLHVLLQGHRIGEEQALVRTASRFYTANHGIKVYEATYTVGVAEYIDKELEPVKATVRITTAVR
jgi:hypothetical protein